MSIVSNEYKGLVPSTVRDCKVCLHKDHDEYLKRIYDRQISVGLAADEMKLSYTQWRNHLKFCVKGAIENAMAPDVELIAKKVVDYTDELVGQLDRTKTVIDKLIMEMESAEEFDSKMYNTCAVFEKQLAHNIEMMAKISGDLNNSAVVNINNVKMEFNDFKGKVLEILCPTCKEKLLDIDEEKKDKTINLEKIDND